MLTTRFLTVAVAACLLGTARAQLPISPRIPAPGNQAPKTPGGGQGGVGEATAKAGKTAEAAPLPMILSVHDVATSRRVFLACDTSSDDRIDVFEAKASLPALGDRARFRAVDHDNDGVIHFAEFDAYYLATVSRGGTLHVAPSAAARLASTLLTPVPLRMETLRLFAVLDLDGNGRLDADEWKNLARVLGRDPAEGFLALDHDLSGGLTVQEIESELKTLTLVLPGPSAVKKPLRPLPRRLRQADVDGNSLLGTDEVARALARIHPTLTRHTAAIIAGADKNGDGNLHRFEALERLEIPPKRIREIEPIDDKKPAMPGARNNR